MTLLVGTVSGQQPKRFIPPPAPLLPAELAWTVALDAVPAGPGAIDDDSAYIPLTDADADTVIALDRETGLQRWSQPAHEVTQLARTPHGTLAIAPQTLTLLRAESGDVIWSVPLPARLTLPPVVAGAQLIMPVAEMLLAIDEATGVTQWTIPMPVGAVRGLASDDTALYLTGAESAVVAVARLDGRVRWRNRLTGTLTQPAIARDRVYVGSDDNALFALDASSGSFEWRRRVGGDVVGAASEGERVFFASLDNILYALNRGNGNQRWKQVVPTRPILPPLAFGDAVFVFGVAPAIAAFDGRTGASLGVLEVPPAPEGFTPGELQGPPLVGMPLRPFRVSAVLVTKDGRALGVRSTGMMFREAAPVPFIELPGRPLTRERLP